MAACALVLSEQFDTELRRIKAQYPACIAAFDVAMRTIEQSAGQCGISTNRELSYLGTREQVDAPGFWIFFRFDDDKNTATLVPPISERPRTLNLAAEIIEE